MDGWAAFWLFLLGVFIATFILSYLERSQVERILNNICQAVANNDISLKEFSEVVNLLFMLYSEKHVKNINNSAPKNGNEE